jgi:hypothetical protein
LLGLFNEKLFIHSCSFFKEKYENARSFEIMRKMRDKHLEENKFIQEDEDLGYGRTEIVPCRNPTRSRWYDNSNADLITVTAGLIADANSSELNLFENNIRCLRNASASPTAHSKYRSVNGFGNNLKNPYWGSTGAPFGRHSHCEEKCFRKPLARFKKNRSKYSSKSSEI